MGLRSISLALSSYPPYSVDSCKLILIKKVLWMSLLDKLLGRPLASSEQGEQKIGFLSGVPTFGLDGLSSAAYGPEAALTILLPLGAVGLVYIGPIILVILVL